MHAQELLFDWVAEDSKSLTEQQELSEDEDLPPCFFCANHQQLETRPKREKRSTSQGSMCLSMKMNKASRGKVQFFVAFS